MELNKTSETISRSFNEQGEATDRVDSANYNVIDENGITVGSANIGNGYGSANINITGFSDINEGESKMKVIFGIAE